MGLGLALPLLAPSDAAASVSIAVGFDQLVKDADSVVLVTAGDGQSAWEDGRIVTYTKVHVDQGVAGGAPGQSPPFVAVGHLQFESVEAFQAAFAPHTAEILGDVANYTTITPAMQISEVLA